MPLFESTVSARARRPRRWERLSGSSVVIGLLLGAVGGIGGCGSKSSNEQADTGKGTPGDTEFVSAPPAGAGGGRGVGDGAGGGASTGSAATGGTAANGGSTGGTTA